MIPLQLPPQELAYVLDALGRCPHNEVRTIIDRIIAQREAWATEQIKARAGAGSLPAAASGLAG